MDPKSSSPYIITKYPDALRQEFLPQKNIRLKIPSIGLGYYRRYSLITYALMFFAFAFIGWCWEVLIHMVEDHVFVNRGTMAGPWLPIYGVGGIIGVFIMTTFGKKLLKYPILTFLTVMLLCGIIEYFTSYTLEKIYGIRWWDYTGYILNINGRICLEGVLIFGFGGCAAIYFIAPAFDNMLSKISLKRKLIILCVICPLFIADLIYSNVHPNIGKGITDYKSDYMKPIEPYSIVSCISDDLDDLYNTHLTD